MASYKETFSAYYDALTEDVDRAVIADRCEELLAQYHPKRELALAQEMFTHLDKGLFRAGGILWEGRLLAIALAEKCGETLICHIEKALYSHAGVYPAMVQKFAAYYGGDCRWVNRAAGAVPVPAVGTAGSVWYGGPGSVHAG